MTVWDKHNLRKLLNFAKLKHQIYLILKFFGWRSLLLFDSIILSKVASCCILRKQILKVLEESQLIYSSLKICILLYT